MTILDEFTRQASSTVGPSRFAGHHFLDPLAVLREMTRVCATGGRVVVVDSAPAPEKADAFNATERLRLGYPVAILVAARAAG